MYRRFSSARLGFKSCWRPVDLKLVQGGGYSERHVGLSQGMVQVRPLCSWQQEAGSTYASLTLAWRDESAWTTSSTCPPSREEASAHTPKPLLNHWTDRPTPRSPCAHLDDHPSADRLVVLLLVDPERGSKSHCQGSNPLPAAIMFRISQVTACEQA